MEKFLRRNDFLAVQLTDSQNETTDTILSSQFIPSKARNLVGYHAP